MPRISKAEKLAQVHERAIKRYDKAYECQQEIRLQCLKDRRFTSIPGAQWEGGLEDQFENRPRFEVNKILLSIQRIYSEYRNNRISVDFRPKNDKASDKIADALDGLYRADEMDSGAQEAYDNAFDEGLAGGFGAWRLCAEYEDKEDEDSEEQRIKIEPITDADVSVWFDPDAKRYDKSDAKWAMVIFSMSPDAYREEYDREPTTLARDNLVEFDWFTPDVVYVGEYYERTEEYYKVQVWRQLATGHEVKITPDDMDEEALTEKLVELEATGYQLAREKKVERYVVNKYIVDGNEVLEDCGRIAGSHIPIVPFYARRLFVDNVERVMGHGRLARDTQQLYNMVISMIAEIATLSPVEKPIFTPEQVAGHEYMWAEDNVKRYPFLLTNAVTDAAGNPVQNGPIGYTKPPSIPPALAGLIQILGADMQEVLGAQQSAEEVVSNVSAKAVELIQNRLDMQTLIYMDNMAKSMRRGGQIWLSMARELYDEKGRKMRVVTQAGDDSTIELKRPNIDEQGNSITEFDLQSGVYDVYADVGPSMTTRRDSTVRSLSGMLQFVEDPSDRTAIAGSIVMNLEGEGLEDLKAYQRQKLLAIGAVKPNEQEKAQMQQAAQNQQPDANTQYLQAAAEKEIAQAEKDRAQTDKYRAETAQIATQIDQSKLDMVLQLLQQMQASQQPQVAQSIPVDNQM